MSAVAIRTRIETIKALKRRDEQEASSAKNRMDDIEAQIKEREGAILLCQRCMDEQADMKKFLESMVTALLRPLFGPEFALILEKEIAADGVTTKGFKVLIQGDDGVLPPKQHGGGVRAVVTLGIRMCFLAFLGKRLGLTMTMFLDEHLNNLDREKWPVLIRLLRSFQDDIPVQFIFITHSDNDVDEFARTIKLYKTGRVTRVQQWDNADGALN